MPEPLVAIRNTAPKWLKGAVDSTVRNRFLLAHLKKEGRITFNANGYGVNWLVQAREPQASVMSAGAGVTYVGSHLNEALALPYAGMYSSDALDYKVQLMNSGETQIFDLFGSKLENCTKTLSRTLCRAIYGQNLGDENQLVGIRSPMIADGATGANDLVAVPASTATYAGKSVQLGNLGGAWSTDLPSGDRPSSVLTNDWPYGSGSSEYDYLTPKMLQYTSNRWGTGLATWRANCEVVMRRGMSFVKHLSGETGVPSIYVLAQRLFDEFRDSLQTKERLFVSDYAKNLGFPGEEALSFNGCTVITDYDCPADKGYALNISQMELMSMHDNLFFMEGPIYDHRSQSNDFFVGFYGQLKFNPKYVVEFGKYA